ncbi:lasso peptide isopeptide bond-forming cyclase [Actinoallomurus vinaceus]|uniref:asparagine synthase (glutamine-hydrolyzing) n=1 Tax=Actinoallomurus vinaceus TaxID=1080074 RepID=A0ABP8U8V8_9ACTN
MNGSDETWFVALPDREDAADAVAVLRPEASQEVPHPSGRPFLIGNWSPDELRLAGADGVQVAVLGPCRGTAALLADQVAGTRTVADLDRPASALAGSFHLIASVDGRVRVQGTVSGLRRVFQTRIGRVTVAGDRSDTLAALAGSDVDEEHLALYLLYPWLPFALTDLTPWRGVQGVAADHYLLLDDDGAARTVPWWRPPEPDLSLAEGAGVLADRLAEAVAIRTTGGGIVSADLSGGLDSTTLCFLAADRGVDLLGVTVATTDPGNDDVAWAVRAADRLTTRGRVVHEVIDPGDVPLPYEGIVGVPPMDEPFGAFRDIARSDAVWQRMARRGSRVHLSGFGGDEVLQSPPAYLHTLARRRPLTTLSHLRGYRARYRWPLGGSLRALADTRAYGRWLAEAAQDIDRPVSLAGEPHRWEPAFRLPPWATDQAVETVRRVIREAAGTAAPLALDRARHEALVFARQGAKTYRQAVRQARRAGLTLAVPFLDDRVLEACLAVRMEERTDPRLYKPLLTEAMAGTVPRDLLERTTKGHYAVDGHAGLRRFRARFAELLEDPLLARLGLVDAEALRSACLSLYPPTLGLPALDATLACEVWLRAARTSRDAVVKGRS